MADGIENGTLINRIHVYTGDPTKGLTDGTLVSQGDFSAPIVGASLNIGTSEIGAPIKCAVRCEPNMITQGPVQLMFVGPNADKWAFGEDEDGVPGTWSTWGGSATFANAITDVNSIFWVRARAMADEVPMKDDTTYLSLVADVYSV